MLLFVDGPLRSPLPPSASLATDHSGRTGALHTARGFTSRSEFIRYALRESVNHPEGAGFWKDLAISEAQFDDGEGRSSDEIKAEYGTDGE